VSAWYPNPKSESIIFQDKQATTLPGYGTIIHRFLPTDVKKVFPHHDQPVGDWVLEFDNGIAATGGMSNRCNEPYKEIYVEVAAAYRRRGLGSYLIQELKRLCYDNGHIPCARCDAANEASLKTIQKAGFVACAHILTGSLSSRPILRTQQSFAHNR
jgi:GNAT superfamily N-acetyltransferase